MIEHVVAWVERQWHALPGPLAALLPAGLVVAVLLWILHTVTSGSDN